MAPSWWTVAPAGRSCAAGMPQDRETAVFVVANPRHTLQVGKVAKISCEERNQTELCQAPTVKKQCVGINHRWTLITGMSLAK